MSELNIEFTTLDGREVKYQLTALKRKEAALVFHNTLRTLLSSFLEAGEDGSNTQAAFVGALRNFEFDLFWDLASRLLKNCMVFADDKIVEIKSIDLTDYFDDRQDEMYWAVFHAVKANFPKFFSGLMEKLGFDPETPEETPPSQ